MSRPPLPPFTEETAKQKVRMAEDGWNSRDPAKVALAYTPESQWRNRVEFVNARLLPGRHCAATSMRCGASPRSRLSKPSLSAALPVTRVWLRGELSHRRLSRVRERVEHGAVRDPGV
jgi:hypothetical protein